MTDTLKDDIRRLALEAGFADVAFASAAAPESWAADLDRWLAQDRHGQMEWMATHRDRRIGPQSLWPDVRSVICLALSYAPKEDPLANHAHPDRGAISVYAGGTDYHDLMKRMLKQVARTMVERWGCEVKVFVDTAPVLEKPIAATTGLGWRGHHTNLVSRRLGNWFFLGEIFTTLEIPPDPPHADHCGSCDACRTSCPTDALRDGMDATRCISYLTIEHKGHIPRDLRPLMGNRIYGCDDCLGACPWNKFASPANQPAFFPRAELQEPRLADLAQLDDAGFRQVFQGSPIKRVGRDRFVRNVLIAIGNSGLDRLYGAARHLLDDESPLVRGAAAWAVQRLGGSDLEADRRRRLAVEDDPEVRGEWDLE
jgi:epoxyqueuosine reductase